jgi:hypothetical protein
MSRPVFGSTACASETNVASESVKQTTPAP